MRDLLTMDGYGIYIWSAYGLTIAVLALLFLITLLRRRKIRQKRYQQQDRKI